MIILCKRLLYHLGDGVAPYALSSHLLSYLTVFDLLQSLHLLSNFLVHSFIEFFFLPLLESVVHTAGPVPTLNYLISYLH